MTAPSASPGAQDEVVHVVSAGSAVDKPRAPLVYVDVPSRVEDRCDVSGQRVQRRVEAALVDVLGTDGVVHDKKRSTRRHQVDENALGHRARGLPQDGVLRRDQVEATHRQRCCLHQPGVHPRHVDSRLPSVMLRSLERDP